MVVDGKAQSILIVEDEMLLALYLEDLLVELGHQVAEIAVRIDKALEIVARGETDFAVLDVNVAGKETYPVADRLRARGTPFVFATGYGSEGLVGGYRDDVVMKKPYTSQQLVRALAQVFPVTGG